MYIWNTRGLADDLSARRVPEHEKFKYLLAFVFASSLFQEAAQYVPEAVSIVALTGSVLRMVVVILGTAWAYLANKQGDNQFFLERFVCLSLPVLVRAVVIFTALYTGYLFLGALIGGDMFVRFLNDTTPVDVAFFLCFEIAVLLIIRNYVAHIALGTCDPSQHGRK